MKINIFLNIDEEKEVKKNVKDLLRHPDWDFIESGGLGVNLNDVYGDVHSFNIYRVLGTIDVKIKGKKKVV